MNQILNSDFCFLSNSISDSRFVCKEPTAISVRHCLLIGAFQMRYLTCDPVFVELQSARRLFSRCEFGVLPRPVIRVLYTHRSLEVQTVVEPLSHVAVLSKS
jgi:hypothetical protein